MEILEAIQALSALAQETRFNAYRELVRRGPEGCCAGELCQSLAVPPATLSFHLKALTQAGLTSATRCGREQHYRVLPETLDRVMGYLNQHCCALPKCTQSPGESKQ